MRARRGPRLLVACLVCLSAVAGCAADDELLPRLRAIHGLTVVEVHDEPSTPSGYRQFKLEFLQPVDHHQPEGPQFAQRMVLLHKDERAPMVQVLSGYNLIDRPYLEELTWLFHGNQLLIEHRYFGGSQPEPLDWSKLGMEQSAADIHRIHDALVGIYERSWIATGHSKGGVAAIAYRRYWPEDVVATLAYVAPLLEGDGDARFAPFLAHLGTSACRDALRTFQRTVLLRRSEVVAQLGDEQADRHFNTLGVERALEQAVIELPFLFWQYLDETACASVPPADADAEQLVAFLDSAHAFTTISDEGLATYLPYYYQSAHELGYPAYEEEHLADLLRFPGVDTASHYAVLTGAAPAFDPTPMTELGDWISSSAERLMLLYGENDPWSAGAVDLTGARDSLRFMVPHSNHLTGISSLGASERQEAIRTLSRWLDAEPASTAP